jgi:hypothetical protein
MTAATTITLTCPECRHENEIERIYCHSCGARLERSAISARKMPKTEAPEQIQKRLQGIFNQRKVRIRSVLLQALKLTVAAGVAAALAEMLIPPDVPPQKKSDILPPQINMDLETMIQYHRPPFLRYDEDGVNGFIANTLRAKKEKLNHPLIDFNRAVVRLNDGRCGLTVERSIFGYSVYTTGTYSVELRDGKVSSSTSGGSIGRLQIHPGLMKYAGFLFGDLVAAMQREAKQLSRVGSIEFHDKEVLFAAPR